MEATPAILELFGHSIIAGVVSEYEVGSSVFIRIDVPSVELRKEFTKIYHPNAIFSIPPCDEETMLHAVRAFEVQPIATWRFPRLTANVDESEPDVMEDF